MTKEEHDAYIKNIELQYADYLKKWDEINPPSEYKHYDRQKNPISLCLLLILKCDLRYCTIRYNNINAYTVLTKWSPKFNSPVEFETLVTEHKKYYSITYKSEKEAIEGHEKIMKQLEEGNFSIKDSNE